MREFHPASRACHSLSPISRRFLPSLSPSALSIINYPEGELLGNGLSFSQRVGKLLQTLNYPRAYRGILAALLHGGRPFCDPAAGSRFPQQQIDNPTTADAFTVPAAMIQDFSVRAPRSLQGIG